MYCTGDGHQVTDNGRDCIISQQLPDQSRPIDLSADTTSRSATSQYDCTIVVRPIVKWLLGRADSGVEAASSPTPDCRKGQPPPASRRPAACQPPAAASFAARPGRAISRQPSRVIRLASCSEASRHELPPPPMPRPAKGQPYASAVALPY